MPTANHTTPRRRAKTLKTFTFDVLDCEERPIPGCQVTWNREDGYAAHYEDQLLGYAASRDEADVLALEFARTRHQEDADELAAQAAICATEIAARTCPAPIELTHVLPLHPDLARLFVSNPFATGRPDDDSDEAAASVAVPVGPTPPNAGPAWMVVGGRQLTGQMLLDTQQYEPARFRELLAGMSEAQRGEAALLLAKARARAAGKPTLAMSFVVERTV